MAECDDGETSGGYDHTFVGNVEKYECTICMLVMRDPQLIVSCGQHSFCGTCLNKWIKTSAKPLVCPSDKIEFDQSKVVADARLAREIHDLRVYCQYDTQGCTETPELRDLQEHLDKCKFAPIEQLRNENRNLREALGKLTVENKELLDNVQRLNNEITIEKERLNNEIKTEKEKLTKVTEDNHKLRNKIIKRDDSIATLTNTATNKNQESRDKMRELGEKIRLLNIELKFVNKDKEKQNELIVSLNHDKATQDQMLGALQHEIGEVKCALTSLVQSRDMKQTGEVQDDPNRGLFSSDMEDIKCALNFLAESIDMKPTHDLILKLATTLQNDPNIGSLPNKIEEIKHALTSLAQSSDMKSTQDLLKKLSGQMQKDQKLASLHKKIDELKRALISSTCSNEVKPMQDLMKQLSEEVQSSASETRYFFTNSEGKSDAISGIEDGLLDSQNSESSFSKRLHRSTSSQQYKSKQLSNLNKLDLGDMCVKFSARLNSVASFHIPNNDAYGVESLDDNPLLHMRVVVKKHIKRKVLSRFYTESGYRMCLTIEWIDDYDISEDEGTFVVKCLLIVGENDDIIPWPYTGVECLWVECPEGAGFVSLCVLPCDRGSATKRPYYSPTHQDPIMEADACYYTANAYQVFDITVKPDEYKVTTVLQRGFRHKVESVNAIIKEIREGTFVHFHLTLFKKVLDKCGWLTIVIFFWSGLATCVGKVLTTCCDKLHMVSETLTEFVHNVTTLYTNITSDS